MKKILFSIFILFHLAVIIIFPNGSSYLGRASTLLVPYANILGLNTTWNFFSPDPAHTMFLKYSIRFEDADGNELREPLDGFIPPEKEQIAVDSSKRRFLYAVRFLILDTNRMKVILGPWLCRQNPGASHVKMEQMLEPIPNLDKAILGDLGRGEETTVMRFDYRCNASQEDEVSL